VTRAPIRAGAAAAIAGGILRAIGSFAPVAIGPDVSLDPLYFTIDACLAVGVTAFFFCLPTGTSWPASTGFVLTLMGIAVVRMNGHLSMADLYPGGALAITCGLVILSVSGWRAARLRAWVPAAFMLSLFLGVTATAVPGAGIAFVCAGVLFGIAFAALGAATWVASAR
jgi:hypothetical protein